ncbi:MAG: hypothetical protein HDR43_00155 [Mycoplasma sp.]|nr:hypothetical protein [Mycoplasma sp.]
MLNEFEGFNKVSQEEQKTISAGMGISDIIPIATSGLSSIANIADDISNTVIKNKIVNKMDEVQKGEIELGKDGQIRLKWDSLKSSGDSVVPKIIF